MPSESPSTEGETDKHFVIERVFDAPPALVFKAWTEPDRLAQWWGPKGFTVRVDKLEACPGGIFHYCLNGPNGMEMWGKWIYYDLVAPERIEFVSSFSDKDLNTTRHPMVADWPLETHTTMTLVDQQGKTRLKIQGYPVNATEAECKTFEAGRDSMRDGFSGTLDQLAQYLTKT